MIEETGTFEPPHGSGITVERGPGGRRLTLPRLHAQADVVAAVLSAGVAVWVGVWLDATSTGPGGRTLAWLAMAAVGVFFAALAVAEAVPVVTRRVIEDAGDRIVLSRQLGARRVLRKRLRKSEIRSIGRVWREDEPGGVEIEAGEAVYRVGKRLDVPALEWLERELRDMAGVPGDPGRGAPGRQGTRQSTSGERQ